MAVDFAGSAGGRSPPAALLRPTLPSSSSQGAAIDASCTGASADHDQADAALPFSRGRCQNIDAAERGAYGDRDMGARTRLVRRHGRAEGQRPPEPPPVASD